MDLNALAEAAGIDPAIGGEFGVSGVFVYLGLFPAAKLRRKRPHDKAGKRTGEPFVPKSVQPLAVGIVVIAANAAAGLGMGVPVVHSISAGLSAAALAMMAYARMKPREKNDE